MPWFYFCLEQDFRFMVVQISSKTGDGRIYINNIDIENEYFVKLQLHINVCTSWLDS